MSENALSSSGSGSGSGLCVPLVPLPLLVPLLVPLPEVAKTLEQMYSEATGLVSFISPAAAAWLEHETRNLPRLLDDRP